MRQANLFDNREDAAAKFGSKVTAEQWYPDRPVTGVLQPNPHSSTQFIPHVFTADDDVTEVSPGDWIVTDSRGERYVYSDRVFKQSYSPVDDEAAIALARPQG